MLYILQEIPTHNATRSHDSVMIKEREDSNSGRDKQFGINHPAGLTSNTKCSTDSTGTTASAAGAANSSPAGTFS